MEEYVKLKNASNPKSRRNGPADIQPNQKPILPHNHIKNHLHTLLVYRIQGNAKVSIVILSKIIASSLTQSENLLAAIQALFGVLNFERGYDLPAHDVSVLLKIGLTLTLPSQDRAVAMMQSEQLQNWVTCGSSSMLHVNGHMFLSSGDGEERRSPLSFLCAKLADSLISQAGAELEQDRMKIFAVRWFCGEHIDKGDYDAHPSGMMNSLISQLLVQLYTHTEADPDPDLDLSSILAIDRRFQNDRCEDLCQIFSDLTRLLPSNTVLFCIVDGIMYYEDSRRREDLITVLQSLVNIASKETGGCIFKLLTTAPLRLYSVQQELFAEENVLEMDEYIPNLGGFTPLQWSSKMERHVEEING